MARPGVLGCQAVRVGGPRWEYFFARGRGAGFSSGAAVTLPSRAKRTNVTSDKTAAGALQPAKQPSAQQAQLGFRCPGEGAGSCWWTRMGPSAVHKMTGPPNGDATAACPSPSCRTSPIRGCNASSSAASSRTHRCVRTRLIASENRAKSSNYLLFPRHRPSFLGMRPAFVPASSPFLAGRPVAPTNRPAA